MSGPIRLEPGPLAWAPGQGGLLLPLSGAPPLRPPAEEAAPVHELHLTLLRSADMAPLVEPLGPRSAALSAELPLWIPVWVSPDLWPVARPPHPTRDPPGELRPVRSWVQRVLDPAPHLARRAALVARLDAASRALGGPAFAPADDGRALHLTRFNNRGGDPRRSVGDVGPADLSPAMPGRGR